MVRADGHSPGASKRGFTFVELLAAMLFLAIVIPVAVEGVLLANRVGSRADHKRESSLLADQILGEAVVTGSWEDGDQVGDFGDDWPEYRWELTVSDWEVEALSVVTVSIVYTVQGQEYSESVSTLVRIDEDV